MKHCTFLFMVFAAAACSCTQEESVSVPAVSSVPVASSAVLALSPSAGTLTGPVGGTAFPPERTMVVSTSVCGTGAAFFTDVLFQHYGGVWSGDMFFPQEESVDILAVSHDGLDVTYGHPSNVADSVTLTVPDNSAVQTDILFGAAKGLTCAATGVPVMMRHCQACVIFTAKSDVAYDAEANTGVTLNGIMLKDVYHAGKVTVSSAEQDYGYARWSDLSEKKDMSLSMTDYDVPTMFMDITVQENRFGIGGAGIIVPEQKQTSVQVSFTLHLGTGSGGIRKDSTGIWHYPFVGEWKEGVKYNCRIDIESGKLSAAGTKAGGHLPPMTIRETLF